MKRYDGHFIVNYDIPALLHKNSAQTDIFSMIIRSFLPYPRFHGLINIINHALEEAEIVSEPGLYSHVFHYSKGPFEQILDGAGYVYEEGGRHLPPAQLSFFSYLLAAGIEEGEVFRALRDPIMRFRMKDGTEQERHLLEYTYEASFTEAVEKFRSMTGR